LFSWNVWFPFWITFNWDIISVLGWWDLYYWPNFVGNISALTWSQKYNFINYWPICIILTWVWNPRVFNTATNQLFQVSDNNMPIDADLLVPFDSPVAPIIGESFTWFTVIAGNQRGFDNVMYVSKRVGMSNNVTPWGQANLQREYENTYDRSPVTIAWQQFATSRAFTSKILGTCTYFARKQ
jgi:hypothetical protein